MHVDVSEVSRMLQFSMNIFSPLHTYVRPGVRSCATTIVVAATISNTQTLSLSTREALRLVAAGSFERSGLISNPRNFRIDSSL